MVHVTDCLHLNLIDVVVFIVLKKLWKMCQSVFKVREEQFNWIYLGV